MTATIGLPTCSLIPAAILLLRRLQAGCRHVNGAAPACAEPEHLHLLF